MAEMPIKVRPAKIEDVEACAEIVVEAYSTITSNALMFPNERESRSKLIQGRVDQFSAHLHQKDAQFTSTEKLKDSIKQDKTTTNHVTQYRVAYLEEEDTNVKQPITALLRWSFSLVEKGTDTTEHDSDTIVDGAVAEKVALLGPDHVNVELFRTFRRSRERKHRQWFQEKGQHIFIHTLAVSPKFQRKGFGAKLMENMIREADEVGLTCYLEASDEGKPLYLRYGFKEVEKLIVQASDDDQKKFALTLMIRHANK